MYNTFCAFVLIVFVYYIHVCTFADIFFSTLTFYQMKAYYQRKLLNVSLIEIMTGIFFSCQLPRLTIKMKTWLYYSQSGCELEWDSVSVMLCSKNVFLPWIATASGKPASFLDYEATKRAACRLNKASASGHVIEHLKFILKKSKQNICIKVTKVFL